MLIDMQPNKLPQKKLLLPPKSPLLKLLPKLLLPPKPLKLPLKKKR